MELQNILKQRDTSVGIVTGADVKVQAVRRFFKEVNIKPATLQQYPVGCTTKYFHSTYIRHGFGTKKRADMALAFDNTVGIGIEAGIDFVPRDKMYPALLEAAKDLEKDFVDPTASFIPSVVEGICIAWKNEYKQTIYRTAHSVAVPIPKKVLQYLQDHPHADLSAANRHIYGEKKVQLHDGAGELYLQRQDLGRLQLICNSLLLASLDPREYLQSILK